MMTLRVKLPAELVDAVKSLARKTGVSPEELVLHALRQHLLGTPADLQHELEAWERASDEDWAKLELVMEHTVDEAG